jgi:hypothetical protein
MNHYDDLQRFKEKTRTQSLNFKDLSSQAAASEQEIGLFSISYSWGGRIFFGHGRSVSLPLPQRVPADMFHWVEAAAVQAPRRPLRLHRPIIPNRRSRPYGHALLPAVDAGSGTCAAPPRSVAPAPAMRQHHR